MENIVTILHVIASAGVIGLVLLQHGKGADMGAAFGSGASGSLFGVSGSSNFLSRATSMCVALFFATSLGLAYIASDKAGSGSVISVPTTQTETTTDASETGLPEATPAANTVDDIPN
jgi:preprotein translocase subunit SecG